MEFSILSKAFQPGGLNWRLCPVPVFHRTHAVHAFCKEILIDFPEWKIRFHICKIQCLEHISLISTATNGWEIPKGNGWEGRSYNFQIKLCGKRSAMCGCPVVNERNISKSENLEIFCSQNFDCCSGKSFGENSQFHHFWEMLVSAILLIIEKLQRLNLSWCKQSVQLKGRQIV